MSTLHHYCSTSAFQSIISEASIWLSAVRLSNDTSEGQILSQTVRRLAAANGVTQDVTDNLVAAVANVEGFYDGFGFCLSAEGDLLSQWRAYADDGRGVSIGFRQEYLDWLVETSRGTELDVELLRVQYDPFSQEDLVRPVFDELRRLLESEQEFPAESHSRPPHIANDPRIIELDGRLAVLTLLKAAMPALLHVYSFKDFSFREEQECRLLHFGSLPEHSCSFRSAGERLVPYHVCSLRELSGEAIEEVVLGPRHTTPIAVVESFMARSGLPSVKVRKSSSPYR